MGLTRKQFLTAGGLVLALALVAAFFPPELRFAAFKDRTAALAASGNRVVHLSWGIQGLLEVISGPAFHHAPGLSLSCTEELPNQAGLFLDGDLTGPITSFRPSPASPGFVGCLLGRVPFELLDPQSALFISPGGGLSLLAGLSKNMKQALAMEDDPRPAALLKGPLAEFSQGLYLDKSIQVRNIDPWTFLHRSEEKFQAVVLGNGTAWGAGGESGLGVTRLLTQEGVGLMLGPVGAGRDPGPERPLDDSSPGLHQAAGHGGPSDPQPGRRSRAGPGPAPGLEHGPGPGQTLGLDHGTAQRLEEPGP